MSPWFAFLLGALALWRATHLVQAEDGPWDLIARLRRSAGAGFLGKLLDCFYCLSLWLAAPLAWWLGDTLGQRLLLWLALSGAACLLERATADPQPPPIAYYEDPETEP